MALIVSVPEFTYLLFIGFPLMLRTRCGSDCISSCVHLFTFFRFPFDIENLI